MPQPSRKPSYPTIDAAAEWAMAHPEEPVAEIARRYRVSREAIGKRLRAAGVRRRSASGPFQLLEKEANRRVLVERALRENWTLVQLAGRLGVTVQRAWVVKRDFERLFGPVEPEQLTPIGAAAAEFKLSLPVARQLIRRHAIQTVHRGQFVYLDASGLEFFRKAVADFDDRRCLGCGGRLKNRRQTRWCSQRCRGRRRVLSIKQKATKDNVGPTYARLMQQLAGRRESGRLVGLTEASALAGCSAQKLQYLRSREILSSTPDPERGNRRRLFYTGELAIVRKVLGRRPRHRQESGKPTES